MSATGPTTPGDLPHSRACGISKHDHGWACHSNCPTCGGNAAFAPDAERGGESGATAAPVCDHYWAWVSPAGARKSARICMSCHQPDPEWLNHTAEVDLGHDDCLHCEFADHRPAPLAEPSAPEPVQTQETLAGRESLALVLSKAGIGLDEYMWPTQLASAVLAAGWASPADHARALTEAWDQGYTSGHSNAMRRMSDEPNAPTTPNPFRKGDADD